MRSISCHVTLLIINSLRVRTHTTASGTKVILRNQVHTSFRTLFKNWTFESGNIFITTLLLSNSYSSSCTYKYNLFYCTIFFNNILNKAFLSMYNLTSMVTMCVVICSFGNIFKTNGRHFQVERFKKMIRFQKSGVYGIYDLKTLSCGVRAWGPQLRRILYEISNL